MDRLQDLVRYHRLGTGCRETSRLLRLGPNQERKYREALAKANLLEGDPECLPSVEELKAAVMKYEPPKQPPQQISSVEHWRSKIEKMLNKGARPRAIFDKLNLEDNDFSGSLWAVKRMCRQLKEKKKVDPKEVGIPVITSAGEVAQVDFGHACKL